MGNLKSKLFVFLLLGLFMFILLSPLVMGFEFDNVKDYDQKTRTVTITNAYGLGDVIGQARLNTPLNVKVGAGYQKVAEFNISVFQDYSNALKQFKFKDMKTKGEINRDYDLKYLSYEEVSVDDYETIENGFTLNGTINYESVKVGSHFETRKKWNKISPADLKKNDILTIGVFTDVQVGDYVDWVPIIYGVEVEEWATWTEDLNVDLVSYYKLDENAANTTVADSHGDNTGTASTNTANLYDASGKINSAFDFDGTDDRVSATTMGNFGSNLDGGFSISFWIKTTESGGYHHIMGSQNSGATTISIPANDGGDGHLAMFLRDEDGNIMYGKTTNDIGYNDGNWHHIVYTVNGNTNTLVIYMDNISKAITYTIQTTPDSFSNFDNSFLISAHNDEGTPKNFLDATFDEVGIWSRVLTSDEVTELYNNGDGMTYLVDLTVTLNSPTDNYISNSNLNTFNATGGAINGTLVNMSLWTNETGSWELRNLTTGLSEITETETWDRTLSDGVYLWNVQACDSGKCAFATANRTLLIDTTVPTIEMINNPTFMNLSINHTINFTATTDNLDKCWIVYNGTNRTIACVSGAITPYNFTVNPLIKTGIIYVNNTAGTSASLNFNITFDPTAPTITPVSGNGTLNYGSLSINHTLNYTVTDTNLVGCWLNYNSTNRTIPCTSGVINTTNFTLVKDLYTATIYANDSIGNINSQLVEWNYKVLENSFIFNNETLAGDQEDFSLNITLLDGYDLSSAVFNYNGYEKSAQIASSGQDRIISISDYSIPIYLNDTNVSIHFTLTLDDSTEINNSAETQLVVAVFLDNCSTYTNQLFNISLFDEEVKTPLLGDIEFNFDLLNKPAYEVVGDLNLKFEDVSVVEICSNINFTDQDYAQSIEIRYYSDGYVKELYNIQKADITSNITQLNLYDLNSTDSTEFLIKYQDNTLTTVEGAVIQLLRKYISEDAYETVEAPLTSSIGTAIVHIDLNTNLYKAIVVKDGVVLDIFNNLVFDCENELSGQCTQNLFGSINPQNSESVENLNDFSYSVTSVNNTITTTFSIPSGSPSAVNILLSQKDMFGNSYLCNKTVTSSGGSIDCDYNDTIGDSIVTLKINKQGVQHAYSSYNIAEAGSVDWLGNNFFIVFILLLSLVGMGMASPEWMIINSVVTIVLCGGIWLLSGLDFVAGLGTLIWLLISAIILIFKISKQEDR